MIALLLLHGSIINHKKGNGQNALTTHLYEAPLCNFPVDNDIVMLLFAAGEYITQSDIEVPDCLDFELRLEHLCRETITDHLIDLEACEPLFHRVAQLNLPPLLRSYLLYDESPQKYCSDACNFDMSQRWDCVRLNPKKPDSSDNQSDKATVKDELP